jgi:hypothetical protein
VGCLVVAAHLAEDGQPTARPGQERSPQHDANAYSLVARTLQPPAGASPPSHEDLNQALQRRHRWYRARSSPWRNQRLADETSITGRKNLIRTGLVFRALIAAVSSFHRNCGQLGYALRFAIPPSYLDEVEEALTAAITRRDAVGEMGWLICELTARRSAPNRIKNPPHQPLQSGRRRS